jgi:four helix bundle protein
MKESILYNISYKFSLKALDIGQELEKLGLKFIANQISKSATSIAANVSESMHSESTNDFIHKLKIASKEANETTYWLNVIRDKEYLELNKELFDNVLSIQKILSKSISTAKRNASH